MAVIVRLLFNAAFRDARWPAKWRTETTVVIPKTSCPSSLAECRNISCTPFLSKVMESLLLDDLRREIDPDPIQYGGIKGCSVDHLLIDIHHEILGALDKGNPAVVLGIDYEKAFNRLDHGECLRQLRRLGASETSIGLVRAFLTGRRMRVKIGASYSSLRPLLGGSPQGSILGCLLYCLATQQINADLATQHKRLGDGAGVTLPHRHPSGTSDHDQRDAAEPGMMILECEMGQDPDPHSDSDDGSEQEGVLLSTAPSSPDELPRITMVKYVDDTTTVEIVCKDERVKHFTTDTTTELVPAVLTSGTLLRIVEKSRDIGMKVNSKKTQMTVVSPDNGCHTTAALTVDGETITSVPNIKLLGYMIGETPGAGPQLSLMKSKFRAHFWSLVHLRNAGVRGIKLFRIYTICVRPVLEVNTVVFHPQLTREQSRALERLQNQVVRLCFGPGRPFYLAR